MSFFDLVNSQITTFPTNTNNDDPLIETFVGPNVKEEEHKPKQENDEEEAEENNDDFGRDEKYNNDEISVQLPPPPPPLSSDSALGRLINQQNIHARTNGNGRGVPRAGIFGPPLPPPIPAGPGPVPGRGRGGGGPRHPVSASIPMASSSSSRGGLVQLPSLVFNDETKNALMTRIIVAKVQGNMGTERIPLLRTLTEMQSFETTRDLNEVRVFNDVFTNTESKFKSLLGAVSDVEKNHSRWLASQIDKMHPYTYRAFDTALWWTRNCGNKISTSLKVEDLFLNVNHSVPFAAYIGLLIICDAQLTGNSNLYISQSTRETLDMKINSARDYFLHLK